MPRLVERLRTDAGDLLADLVSAIEAEASAEDGDVQASARVTLP